MKSPISRLGFGCVGLTQFSTVSGALRHLDQVRELGILHYDTAPSYGKGFSEVILGKFLRRSGKSLTVATKFSAALPPRTFPATSVALLANRMRRAGRPNSAQTRQAVPASRPLPTTFVRITKAALQANFENSCRALQRERIDFYLLHESAPAALEASALEYLKELIRIGRIGKLGVAANGGYFNGLSMEDLLGWEILQYEKGPEWPGHDGLMSHFPGKMHIHHSCFWAIRGIRPERHAAREILRERLAQNPQGLVLFSSSKIENVRDNLDGL